MMHPVDVPQPGLVHSTDAGRREPRSRDLDRERHEALTQAEMHRLRRILRSYGTLPRATLRRLAEPSGREIDFDSALGAGVRSGQITALGFGFYEAADTEGQSDRPVAP